MPGVIAPLTAVGTAVGSNAIFAYRRADRGIDEIQKNPLTGTMNLDIAAGQVVKGTNATVQALPAEYREAIQSTLGATDKIKGAEKATKATKALNYAKNGAKAAINFAKDYTNELICLTSAVNVLTADDKEDAAAREIIALPTMFAFEKCGKEAMGLYGRKSLLLKNDYIKKHKEAIDDFCATKKLFNKISLKPVPGLGAGIAFAGMSIAGYKTGTWLGNCLLGKEKNSSAV